MTMQNKYNGWYDLYKISQRQVNGFPYRAVKIINDEGVPITELSGFTINAVSAGQAWKKLTKMKEYDWVMKVINEYRDMGYVVELQFDNEGHRQQKQIDEIGRNRQERIVRDKEKLVQDAWWNK